MRVPARLPRAALLPSLIIIALMTAGLAVAFLQFSRQFFPLNHVYELSLFLFRSEGNVKVVMALGVLAHVLESSYILWMCSKAKVDGGDAAGWFVLGILVGGLAISSLGHKIKQRKANR